MFQSTHSLRSATDKAVRRIFRIILFQSTHSLRSATSAILRSAPSFVMFQSTHSLRSATFPGSIHHAGDGVSIHALLAECDQGAGPPKAGEFSFQSTHSLRSATAPDLIHCYSTEQIILCANLPKKTVIARLLFLSIYLSIFYSQCITPIADLPGNSCELEVGAQAMFNSL